MRLGLSRAYRHIYIYIYTLKNTKINVSISITIYYMIDSCCRSVSLLPSHILARAFVLPAYKTESVTFLGLMNSATKV